MAARLRSLPLPEREEPPLLSGHLTRVVGLTLEAEGLKTSVGQRCRIDTDSGPLSAEVVGFEGSLVYLMPTDEVSGVKSGDLVTPVGVGLDLPFGDHLLGRVIDSLGRPLDGMGPVVKDSACRWRPHHVNPMSRTPIRKPLDVGIAAINSMLTIGQGQRMGLFAGSGVGKSVLLGMMTRGTSADVVVVGLIGERGREVKEFIEDILGPEGRARSVVIASPADTSALMRLKGCETTLAIAEYFRDQGRNVLLLIDSLTRYAMAQREIALAVGEPPAQKGYPPSVFAKLPALVERAGNGAQGEGSITAFFTVLVEGDDLQDPIADSARAILDGHIVLSRQLADAGHFPAIDVEKSVSRVMPAVVTQEHMMMARTMRQCLAQYNQSRELIQIGAYQKGSDPAIDQAIMIKPHLDAFTTQEMKAVIPFKQSLDGLKNLAMLLINDAQQKVDSMQQQSQPRTGPPPSRQPAAKVTFNRKS
ncbi:MAG: flagellar protein export ATPase FliI [Succinivibrionaceae bacterium]|nr:flagellar protein export ATPase FliI [Succinivibrionaceae bacterium]